MKHRAKKEMGPLTRLIKATLAPSLTHEEHVARARAVEQSRLLAQETGDPRVLQNPKEVGCHGMSEVIRALPYLRTPLPSRLASSTPSCTASSAILWG